MRVLSFKKLVFVVVVLVAFFATTVSMISAEEITGPISRLQQKDTMEVVVKCGNDLFKITAELYPRPVYFDPSQTKSAGLDPAQLIYGEMKCSKKIEGEWITDSQKRRFLTFPSMTSSIALDQLQSWKNRFWEWEIGIYVTYSIRNGKQYPHVCIVYKKGDIRGAALYEFRDGLLQEAGKTMI